MSYSNRQFAFLKDVALLIMYCAQQGFKVTGGELWRSNEEQDRKYRAGLSKAKAGESKHQARMAIDLNFWNIDGKYLPYVERDEGRDEHDTQLALIADYWESLNPKNRAGLYFKSLRDPYHFERMD